MSVALKQAANDMKKYYDQGQQLDDLTIGDLVYLSTKDLSTDQPSKKPDYWQVDPFPIVAKHRKLTYELKLPHTYQIHLVFPVVKLSKAKVNKWE